MTVVMSKAAILLLHPVLVVSITAKSNIILWEIKHWNQKARTEKIALPEIGLSMKMPNDRALPPKKSMY